MKIMKKYCKPTIETVKLHQETHLMDGSLDPSSGVITPGVKPSRRRDSLWEDDEDDWLDE